MIKAVVCGLALLVGSARGQQPSSEARPAYQPFRYDEDWSNLVDNSKRSDWLDPLKYMSLGRSGWFVSLGGEVREKFELLDQPGFGTGSEDDTGYFLQRYLLSSDFHLGSRIRFFNELQSGLENGRNGGPRRQNRDCGPQQPCFMRSCPLRIRASRKIFWQKPNVS